METGNTQQETMAKAEPQKEHRWLEKLVGNWTYEIEATMAPGQPPVKATGTESVRSLGGLWTIAEGQGDMPGCGPAATIMTLGYDPLKKRFVGSFIGSMMTSMFTYNGTLDTNEKVLTLETEGPGMSDPAKTAKYHDIIEIKSDDERTLTSRALGDDGQWHQFMRATYQRKR
ncbi:MAG: DUF1579 domain-containing protein [Acidobacteriota bacterium]